MLNPYAKFANRKPIPALTLIFQDAGRDLGNIMNEMILKHAEFMQKERGIDPTKPSDENEFFLANMVFMLVMNSMNLIIKATGEAVPEHHIEHVAFQLAQHLWGTTFAVIDAANNIRTQKAATKPSSAN